MSLFFAFLIGAIFGSFFNMLIYRLPRNEDLVFKRSHCISCGHVLSPICLIPLFSFLFLKGACLYCSERIGRRYFLVELLSGVLFVGVFYYFGVTLLGFKWLSFLSLLLLAAFIDFETFLIPDRITFIMVGSGLCFSLFQGQILSSLAALFFVGGSFYLLGLVTTLIYKKPTLGGGDIKLVFGIASFWGVWLTVLTLYFSFILGGCLALILLISKKKSKSDYIPFGPSIALAAFLALIFYDSMADYFGIFSL